MAAAIFENTRTWAVDFSNCYALLYLSLLRYVIFSCCIENSLIIACSIQIKDISLYQQKRIINNLKIKAMTTYNQIIETIKSEISNKTITTIQKCRSRIEELCLENDCMNNLLPISYDLGVA